MHALLFILYLSCLVKHRFEILTWSSDQGDDYQVAKSMCFMSQPGRNPEEILEAIRNGTFSLFADQCLSSPGTTMELDHHKKIRIEVMNRFIHMYCNLDMCHKP